MSVSSDRDRPAKDILALTQALSREPHNPVLLEQLCRTYRRLGQETEAAKAAAQLEVQGLVLRRQGNIDAATDVYTRLQALSPTNRRIARLATIFQGRALVDDSPDDAPLSAPFVRLANFLSDADYEAVWQCALDHQADFVPDGVGVGQNKRVDLDVRRTSALHRIGPLRPFFRRQIETCLAEVVPRLQLAPFAIKQIEVKMTVHHNGGYFRLHRDDTRRVSYIYYFHRPNKLFQGGDLVVYDTAPHAGHYHSAAYTRIPPQDNTLVFFPSTYFHEVTPVELESHAFADGRFALSGHVVAEE